MNDLEMNENYVVIKIVFSDKKSCDKYSLVILMESCDNDLVDKILFLPI